MSDFVAARDCFRFDNPEIFYVDFSKISIRQIQKDNTYKINLGIGRENNYFYDGFNQNNIEEAIDSVNKKIDEIVTFANSKDTKLEQLDAVYKKIISSATYALETTARPENKLFVRTPYGALIKGEALCEGFAKTTKIVLDKLGFNSVLLQGMYSYEDKTELHMWNYIQMEDSRWYLLDTTMDNGLDESGKTRNYFMKSGKDKVSADYLPEGSISVTNESNLFELTYPTLSGIPYEENANYFTFTKENDKSFASYLGMGIQEAMKKGKYIVYTYDVTTMKTGWTYFAQSHAAMQVMAGYKPQLSEIDQKDKFDITLLNDLSVVFAVTNVKPQFTFEEIVEKELVTPDSYSYKGSIDEIYHYSNVNGTTPVEKSSPYAIEKSYSGVSLEENKTYTVTVKYSENLKKIYPEEEIKVNGSNLLGEVITSDIKRDKSTPNQITFTFSTTKSYYRNLNYYFTLTNLIGESSHQEPLETSFSVVNNVEFACPQVEGAINTVYTNKPALISDGDMSSSGWTDENGKPLSSDLPFRLALVASKHDEETSSNMIDKIEETGEKVLKSSTFELNLQLCGAQVAFLNGNKLKVLMPFPEGYGPKDKGVTFKAYHFKKDGTPEEIESVITEHGLIMYVDAFSPFAIVVSEGEIESRNVAIQINGQAKVDKNIIKLDKDNSEEITISLDDRNSLDYVLLNGKSIQVANNKINIKYDDLKDYGNVLEINTLIKSIKENEINEGYHSVEVEKPSEDITPSLPEESKDDKTIIIISISVTAALIVISGIVCFIAFKKKKEIKK